MPSLRLDHHHHPAVSNAQDSPVLRHLLRFGVADCHEPQRLLLGNGQVAVLGRIRSKAAIKVVILTALERVRLATFGATSETMNIRHMHVNLTDQT